MTRIAQNVSEAYRWVQNGTAMPHYSRTATGEKDKVIGIRKASMWERVKLNFASQKTIQAINEARSQGLTRLMFDQNSNIAHRTVRSADGRRVLTTGFAVKGNQVTSQPLFQVEHVNGRQFFKSFQKNVYRDLFSGSFPQLLRKGLFPVRDVNSHVTHRVKKGTSTDKWKYARTSEQHRLHQPRRLLPSVQANKIGQERNVSGYCAVANVAYTYSTKDPVTGLNGPERGRLFVKNGTFTTIPHNPNEVPVTDFPPEWTQMKTHFDEDGILRPELSANKQWTMLPRSDKDKALGGAWYRTTVKQENGKNTSVQQFFKLHEIIESQPTNLIQEHASGNVTVWALMDETYLDMHSRQPQTRMRWFCANFDKKGNFLETTIATPTASGVHVLNQDTARTVKGWYTTASPFVWIDNAVTKAGRQETENERRVKFAKGTAPQLPSSELAHDYQTKYKAKLRAGLTEISEQIRLLETQHRTTGLNRDDLAYLKEIKKLEAKLIANLQARDLFKTQYRSSPVLAGKDKRVTPDKLRPSEEIEEAIAQFVKEKKTLTYSREHTNEHGKKVKLPYKPTIFQDENWKESLVQQHFTVEAVTDTLTNTLSQFVAQVQAGAPESAIAQAQDDLDKLLPSSSYDAYSLLDIFVEHNGDIQWSEQDVSVASLRLFDDHVKANYTKADETQEVVHQLLGRLGTVEQAYIDAVLNPATPEKAKETATADLRHLIMELQNKQIALETHAKVIDAMKQFGHSTWLGIDKSSRFTDEFSERYPNLVNADNMLDMINNDVARTEEALSHATKVFAQEFVVQDNEEMPALEPEPENPVDELDELDNLQDAQTLNRQRATTPMEHLWDYTISATPLAPPPSRASSVSDVEVASPPKVIYSNIHNHQVAQADSEESDYVSVTDEAPSLDPEYEDIDEVLERINNTRKPEKVSSLQNLRQPEPPEVLPRSNSF